MEDALADSEFSAIYENDVKKMNYIECAEYKTKDDINTLFAVPEENTVGTNSITNAITLINFDDGDLKYETIMKDFLPHVFTGNSGFVPEFSDQYIGWVRTRSFAFIDLKNRKLIDDFMPDGSIYGEIRLSGIVDKVKNQFVFLSIDNENFETNMSLIVVEFNEDGGKVIAKKEFGDVGSSDFLGKITFILKDLEEDKQKLLAYDSNLNEIKHPLIDFYNKEKILDYYKKKSEKIKLKKVYKPFVHPDLPFAIVNNKTDSLHTWIVTWNKKDKRSYYNLADKLYPEQLSPDGKWILFTSYPTKDYILMPVNSDLEHYLGEPILLKGFKQSSAEINAWISDPLSFVVSDKNNKKLIKWDISEKNIEKR